MDFNLALMQKCSSDITVSVGSTHIKMKLILSISLGLIEKKCSVFLSDLHYNAHGHVNWFSMLNLINIVAKL